MNDQLEMIKALLELKYIKREILNLYFDLLDHLEELGAIAHGNSDEVTPREVWLKFNDSINRMQDVLNKDMS